MQVLLVQLKIWENKNQGMDGSEADFEFYNDVCRYCSIQIVEMGYGKGTGLTSGQLN